MKIEQVDVACSGCGLPFVVECAVDVSDVRDQQVVECPNPACNRVNHPILRGEQVNWFMLRPLIQAVRDWQSNQDVHRLTCANDSTHAPLLASVGDADELLLICPDCDYCQRKIPPAVLHHSKT